MSESSQDGWLLTIANSFHLFPNKQSAYRCHYSTETVVLSVHNDIVRATDRNLVTGLLLLDLRLAFDTVNHSVLLSVLSKRFSITDTAPNWFQSYLAKRTQSFLYADHQTIPAPVDCGMSQGSAQGPFHFLCYAQDVYTVFDHRDVQYHTFADDMQAYVSSILAVRRTPCAGSLPIASVMRLPGAPHADYS